MRPGRNIALVSAEKSSEKLYYASGRQLAWLKFKKHKLARVGFFVLAILYFLAIFADIVAPYGKSSRFGGHSNQQPSRIRLISKTEGLRTPYFHPLIPSRDPRTMRMIYTPDVSKEIPLRFFLNQEEHKFLGLFTIKFRLFGSADPEIPFYLMGSDDLGRDLFSRILYGARISLFIGFGGVIVIFVLGCLFGGISGYFGGVVDEIVQRSIDFLRSIPTLPLWMVFSTAVPRNWSVEKTYFAITVILGIVGWTGLARVVRGKLLSLREEDYVVAAKLSAVRDLGIIRKHLLPNFMSHLVVSMTLQIPAMILGETALSFLGIGMLPPAVSWGILLADARNLGHIAHHPWILIPAIPVVITVLMYNFIGDGLRDAADPYA